MLWIVWRACRCGEFHAGWIALLGGRLSTGYRRECDSCSVGAADSVDSGFRISDVW